MSEGWVTGRVYRDSQIAQVKEKDVLKFTVECRRNVGQKVFSDYVSVTAYGKEIYQMSFTKGQLVTVTGGRYSARPYTSQKNEAKAALDYNCFVNNITVLERGSQADPAPAQPAPARTAPPAPARPAPLPVEDDVPF